MDAIELPTFRTVEFREGIEAKKNFDNLFSRATEDFLSVIKYYRKWSKWCGAGSIAVRCIAVVLAALSAIAMNGITFDLIPFVETAEQGVRASVVFVVIAGIALSLDYALNITRKFTVWNEISFDLALSLSTFSSAFRRKYFLPEAEYSKQTFFDAKSLCESTFEEFRTAQAKETKSWGQSTREAVEALHAANIVRQTEASTASQRALEAIDEREREQADEEKAKRSELKLVGLSVRVLETSDRTDKTLELIVGHSGFSCWSQVVEAGKINSKHLKKGLYTITLLVDGQESANKAITLDKDREEVI
ncbi:hypothetical protein [uncultured Roseobacter sp.]|uniref:hypothetical protein n=1 Tax=uncultured Roseobacter sp. TaxID=114847 RepID=UPI00260DD66F|nr:hypothetical protein [uncultured Roseobacter sp.]